MDAEVEHNPDNNDNEGGQIMKIVENILRCTGQFEPATLVVGSPLVVYLFIDIMMGR